jgi:hypothetical protein
VFSGTTLTIVLLILNPLQKKTNTRLVLAQITTKTSPGLIVNRRVRSDLLPQRTVRVSPRRREMILIACFTDTSSSRELILVRSLIESFLPIFDNIFY